MPIASINPATGETLRVFDELSDVEIDRCLTRSAEAYVTYRRTSYAQRSQWLRRAADILDEDLERVAETMTSEMGKTITSARQEVQKSANGCRFYAEHAERFLGEEPFDPVSVGATAAYVVYQPLGPVLAVMPWNFPLWQAMRFAAPALMAGNVGLLKHASNVPQTALYMQELFERAGFPGGVFQTLLIGSSKVEAILKDRRVVAATLTGSGPAGSSVAAIAGAHIKPTVLELGGSDPFIVMPSTNLERAAEVAVGARLLNNGQSCINAKRFIVHGDVYEDFERRFVGITLSKVVGDPMDERTDVGPLASPQQVSDVSELVDDAVSKGARVLCGGRRIDGPGCYYEPTVLAGVTPEMRVHTEEAFGPVATLYRVESIDEAIELANLTEFGLGSNVWTEDAAERERFICDIESGMVFVNGQTTSYPELPFGGVKSSGYGRELSANGIRAFCNLKTVWVGAPSHPASSR
jgi:succinate-semialdehyde dehydrogenase/glutarate-semialdehyde dehydrogenase